MESALPTIEINKLPLVDCICLSYGQELKISLRRRHIHCPLSIVNCRLQKYSRPITAVTQSWDESMYAHTSWCHPRSGKISPLCSVLRDGALARRVSFLRCCWQGAFSLCPLSLWLRTGLLLPCHGRIWNTQCRLFLGRIISLQSRSPRCRPIISISAEARLVAQGTL